MKNQYFGDVNDYRKYGLLRSLVTDSGLKLLVAWMLTPDDGGADGSKTAYLSQPEKFGKHDPELYQGLRGFLVRGAGRRVSMIADSHLLAGAGYFSDIVPDASRHREGWFDSLQERARAYDLVFLDPDNGLEVRSKPIGRKDSSKYVAWQEVCELWESGKSLLIYQHFRRVKRPVFIEQMAGELRDRLGAPLIEAFSTAGVLFLLVGQERHCEPLRVGIDRVQATWADQIRVAGLSR